MRGTVRVLLVSTFCFWLVSSAQPAAGLGARDLSEDDYTALKICEGVIQLFRQFPDAVWPGYNLSERPFIFYMPERWVLLFNYSGDVEGFGQYPDDWPDLGTDVLFHEGRYGDLAGQIVFNLPIDTVEVAAVGFPARSNVETFGYIVHENFHQYQFGAFGEIPWEREERYPIEDSQNTALAYLEMRLLMDALEAAAAGEEEACREYVSQFVAVRDHRWSVADPFIRRYEQGQEINEATAQYVETKSIALMKQVKYDSSLRGLAGPLSEDFQPISMPEYLLEDFRTRLAGNSISPADMPRNRIYPLGAAQGMLLDHFGIDWKPRAQEAGPEFTFAELFRGNLGIVDADMAGLLARAKEDYDYEAVLAATNQLIEEYVDSFRKELASFEAQPGHRIEVNLSSRGTRLSRSRSSSARKWVVDSGTRELRNPYKVYVLKSPELDLELHNVGVLEKYDWDASTRTVAFFAAEDVPVVLDGKTLSPTDGMSYPFETIEILGSHLTFRYSKPGTIIFSDGDLRVNLIPPSE